MSSSDPNLPVEGSSSSPIHFKLVASHAKVDREIKRKLYHYVRLRRHELRYTMPIRSKMPQKSWKVVLFWNAPVARSLLHISSILTVIRRSA